ncbi:MAG: TetR/AcrR family transcriptional regulator [Bacillota bacterium]
MCKESLRETRKKELKEEIFLQALRLFKERGYENVTVEDITTACGIAKGTFYNYFSKKEHVLLHLGQGQIEILRESIARHARVRNVRKRLKLIFKDLLARIDREPDLLKATVIEILRSSLLVEEELQLIAEFELLLTPLFEEAVAAGQVSVRWNPRQLSSFLVGTYYYALFSWLAKPAQGDVVALFHTHLDMLWDGIAGEGGKN